jgi:hypothetical protein
MLLGHGAAAYYTKDCHKVEHTIFASTQRVEFYADVMVLRDFPQQPINLYSNSHYVVGVLCCIETAYISHTSSSSYLIFSFSCVVWCESTFIPVLWAICTHILISLAHSLTVMSKQVT